ncbi:MAG: hypothetical protein KF855_05350 [Acidobacteria bacterium]|nr:hypothetical protein [Acidobacteriota bacterium]
MIIREVLESGQSRANMLKIVAYIGDDPVRFRELLDIFFEGEYRMTQRAAWPISVCAEKHPELLMPHLNRLIDQLPRQDVHDAVKRNVVRLLQFVEIPKRLQGKVYSHCLDLIADPKEPVAVKAFSITVARKIAEQEPALMEELRLVVKPQLQNATPALRVRVRGLF